MKKTSPIVLAALLTAAACTPAITPPVAAAPAIPTPAPAIAVPAAAATPSVPARWRADAPLRAGMARVRVAAAALAHAEHGHLDRAQERALADEITAAVNAMFAECRLPPAPDAALHPLLARLLAASQALRERPAEPAVVAELRAVLARYEQLFEETP